ncbi:hypothetical protein l13_08430 [Neisseria weaveri ATCC 51223]|nr:hypothetical protein l13_08430 [Neisseria weaveri ATCC 51223]
MPFWLGCKIGWNYPFFQTAFQGQGAETALCPSGVWLVCAIVYNSCFG